MLHASIINEIAGREVVGAVEHDVASANQLFDVGMVDVYDVWFDLDLGIDLGEVICGGDGFRQASLSVVFGEHRLALQV